MAAITSIGIICGKLKLTDVAIIAKIIALGPVGPEINGELQPKIPETKERIIAPHKPDIAPKPEATPKARAWGKAIIVAIIAPKKSPLNIDTFSLNLDIFTFCFFLNFQR
jgi:hypothetical protein